MDAASNLANRCVRTAAGLYRASRAVRLTGPIDDGVGLGDVCPRILEWAPLFAQSAALRAAVFVGLLVPLELTAGQSVVFALRSVPHRYMRLDRFLVYHPARYLGRPVGGITDEPRRFHVKAFLDPVNHRSR